MILELQFSHLKVEYAMQAINHAGTCVGVTYNDGIILGSEKRNIDKLLDAFLPEKIYVVSDNIICSVAGVTSDATTLINQMRIISENHFYKFQELITLEELVTDICNLKQQYTQIGGYRPFGVSLLYAGWDSHRGFQLLQSDPSGNYSGFKATCVGKNNEDGMTILKTGYSNQIDFNAALNLVLETLFKTVERKPLSSENIELAYITRRENKTVFHMMSPSEIDDAIKSSPQTTSTIPSVIHA